ncbi:MAG: inorganic diphosphatase [Candidatus Bathyarchaeia archaeon]|jgi:inorganic pyrophosphatase
MNFWNQIPSGANPPLELNMVIEVTSGSRSKFEYKSDWEAFVLNRIVPSSVVFPVEYGFVPQTLYVDGDPLDIMALSFAPLAVGTVAPVRVIGVLEMEDEEGLDSKILSVLANDRRFEGYNDLADVQEHQLTEILDFFKTYKRLQPCGWVKVRGWQNKAEATEVVLEAIKSYQSNIATSLNSN